MVLVLVSRVLVLRVYVSRRRQHVQPIPHHRAQEFLRKRMRRIVAVSLLSPRVASKSVESAG